MPKLIFEPGSRSLLPRAARRLTLQFFDMRIPGTVESTVEAVTAHRVTFRADWLAHAGVIRPGSQLTATYQLAHGVVDAQFTIASRDGSVLTLLTSGDPQLQQRRQHPRVHVRLPVHLLVPSAGQGLGDTRPVPTQVDAITDNLSLGGALVQCDPSFALPPDATGALVELDLPSGTVTTAAKLVQLCGHSARMRFTQLDAQDGEQLATYIDQHLN